MNTKILISKCHRIADRFMHYWWCYLLIAFLSFFINAYLEGTMKNITFITCFSFIGISAIAMLMIIISILTTLFKERTRADVFMRYWWCYPLIAFVTLIVYRYSRPHNTAPLLNIIFTLCICTSLLALLVGIVQNRIVPFFQRHKTQIAYWNRRYLGWMLPLLTTLAGLCALSSLDFSLWGIIFLPILLLALVIHLLIGLKQKRFAATFKTIGLFAGFLGLSLGMLYGPLLFCVGMYMNGNNEKLSPIERAAFLKYVGGKEFVIPDFIQYNILEYATLQFPQLDVAKNGQKVTLQGEEYWEIPVSYEGMQGVNQIIDTPKVYFTMDGTAVGLRRDDYKWDLTTLVPDNQNKLLPHIANFTLAFFTVSDQAPKSIAIGVGNLIE